MSGANRTSGYRELPRVVLLVVKVVSLKVLLSLLQVLHLHLKTSILFVRFVKIVKADIN